jgi:hypothetical protein
MGVRPTTTVFVFPIVRDAAGHACSRPHLDPSTCQRECQIECQKECQNTCQKECQIDCQNIYVKVFLNVIGGWVYWFNTGVRCEYSGLEVSNSNWGNVQYIRCVFSLMVGWATNICGWETSKHAAWVRILWSVSTGVHFLSSAREMTIRNDMKWSKLIDFLKDLNDNYILNEIMNHNDFHFCWVEVIPWGGCWFCIILVILL